MISTVERKVMDYYKKHKRLPSDDFEKEYGKPLMSTAQFGADLQMLYQYEVECINKLK